VPLSESDADAIDLFLLVSVLATGAVGEFEESARCQRFLAIFPRECVFGAREVKPRTGRDQIGTEGAFKNFGK
jgi:hypothetical protein